MNAITCACFVVVSCLAGPAFGQTDPSFYSIDLVTDDLVVLDASDGSVSPVGPLGVDVTGGVALDWQGSKLLMLADIDAVESLVEIDPSSGQAVSNVPITLGADNAEGFAVVRSGPRVGEVWVAHGPAPVALTLSVLNFDGSLGQQRAAGVDADDMIWRTDVGSMLCHDGRPERPTSSQRINVMGEISFTSGFVETGSTVVPIDDALGEFAIDASGGLWSLNNRRDELARVNPINAARSDIRPYTHTSRLQGLALALEACNPADLAAPLGVLDLNDIDAFIAAFTAGDAAADLAPPAGVIDLDDIDAFIAAFLAGCP